jgi:flagellar hook-associated protein 1 FlgK
MANSIYSIGLSGLAAAQAGLVATGHNISNVNTPGYSRQEVLQLPSSPQFNGGSFYGRGVDVVAVRRVYSDYLAAQALATRTEAGALSALSTELAQLDNLFGDPASGLPPALSEFFAGVNALAAHPADVPSRQAMLSSAQALAARFRQIDNQMAGLRRAADAQVESTVASINGYVDQIANLNRRIGEVTSASIDAHPPNDLLDQRDMLVGKLNDLIGATAVVQNDGSYNVFTASGQALVVGYDAHHLQAVADNRNPQGLQVALDLGGGALLRLQASDVHGGKLAGVLQYRDGTLTQAQNELGRIALVLANAFNAQHRLGQDLDGQLGGNFFGVPAPSWVGTTTNSGNAALAVSVADAGALTASDYELRYDGTNWKITRLSDGSSRSFATLPQTVDGVTIGVASGAAAAGDSFLVQPTRYAARDIAVLIRDTAKLAAAAPIRTASATSNTGTGAISGGAVNAAYLASPIAASITLTYNAGAATFSGFPASQPVTVTVNGTSTTYPAGTPVPYTAGALIAFGGIEIAISGSPANGDTFNVMPNAGGIGDNRNAQLLAGLAGKNLVAGTATFAAALGDLTARIGNATHEAAIEYEAQAALAEQTERSRQAVSGVNLDEEAANLQRFQQAYQASAEVMRVAASLFDTILRLRE